MLRCQICGHQQDLPRHCGQPMHPEAVDGQDMLVCWMGPSCGQQEVPSHCERPMTVL